MKTKYFILASTLIVACASQRSPYAGLRPIGYPAIETTTLANNLLNRFGETTTTQRLPLEALGDRELVNRLGQLPQDNQPFWLLNWSALEENRKRPQTYAQRPNVFSESIFRELAAASQSNGNQNNSGLNNRNLQDTATNKSEINTQNPKVISDRTLEASSSDSPQNIDNINNESLNGNVKNSTEKKTSENVVKS